MSFSGDRPRPKRAEWAKTVDAAIGETWVWALAPHQPDPQQPGIDWAINRLSGQDALAKRASKRFESDEALLTQLGPGRLARRSTSSISGAVRTIRDQTAADRLRDLSVSAAPVRSAARDRCHPLSDRPASVRSLRLCRWC